MRTSKFIIALSILLVFQVVACPAAETDFGDQARWTQTQYGSTIIIRPANGNREPLPPVADTDVKPQRIVGYRTISEFVNALLGFEPVVHATASTRMSKLD